MNVPFTLHDSALDAVFLQESEAAGLMALKGHKAMGGMRASLYNAVPLEAVQALGRLHARFRQTARLTTLPDTDNRARFRHYAGLNSDFFTLGHPYS